MSMRQEQRDQPTGTHSTGGDADDLARRVREEHPGARDLDRIDAAHTAHGGVRHRIWLDEPAGVLLVLEPAGPELRRMPLRSASCARVLHDLTSPVLARLAAPADSYRARPEVDRDLGALVQLFRVQLARMRTEHTDPAGLVRAVHAQVGRAGDARQAARRAAFLGWYLAGAYGDDAAGHGRAEQDLGCGIAPGAGFAARTIMGWSWFRQRIRGQVPLPRLASVPGERRQRGGKHWYYEFRTIGRSLTERQMLELRAKLPGADVTADSLVLDEWSDPTAHPVSGADDEIFSRHFDAGLRFSQEGSRTLWLRLPAALAHRTAPYAGGGVGTAVVGDDVVLNLHRREADGEGSYLDHDPRPWLAELLPLRDDLAGGDLRAAAVSWRAANETLAFSRVPERPPMPDGLDEDELTPQLHALVRLLEEVP
ncbi:hypothetical protein AB0I52_27890 [Streptomyces sp. NPDC050423]|uniref:hypothetical protein n=1 Tax=Streptomyces sp. NPDC050423 TaxID=3155402 RepID=UPI003424F3C6